MDVKEYNKRYYEKHKEKMIQYNKEYWAAKAKAYRVPDIEGEEWLPLVGFEEHYMASNMGRIKSTWHMKERIIDGSYDKDGYKKITLTYPDRSQGTYRKGEKLFIPYNRILIRRKEND